LGAGNTHNIHKKYIYDAEEWLFNRAGFFEENLNAQRYERLLVDQIIPVIQNTFPNNFEEIWF